MVRGGVAGSWANVRKRTPISCGDTRRARRVRISARIRAPGLSWIKFAIMASSVTPGNEAHVRRGHASSWRARVYPGPERPGVKPGPTRGRPGPPAGNFRSKTELRIRGWDSPGKKGEGARGRLDGLGLAE